ncbi:uncharacterized protein LOC116842474 [Odontomachus brunneus]|uniref:uncharacterized protein LOC116842474 n=1 Tax=Odontomachus brunneus TaxID=486640 RepID=UPI0013F29283|nr:uncharacterized protein LOC116842474 [Odontomachus brunneus]
MQILQLNFLIYTVGGVWRPIAWSSNAAKFLYNVFTFCTIIPLYFLMLTQFMDLVLIVDNMDDFTTNSLMFMTIVAVCCKATIAVFRRNGIISLVQMLLTKPCRPQDEDEVAIQMKFNKFIRLWSIRYSLLATSSVTGVTIKSVLNVMHGILPYRVWLPYDSNVSLSFWITSILQIVSLIFATIINVGTETLVFGLFLQTCAQLEIFERRLYKLVINRTVTRLSDEHRGRFSSSYKEELISKYIHHHLSIYQYAKTVNSVFNQVLFVQFFVSILVLCTSVYYLSSHIMESEAATMIVYTICMFLQIYIYCWSGNEVILKVRDYLHFTSRFTKMQILRLNFLIYTVGGVWRPIAWSSNAAKFLYNVFTFCTIIPLYFLMLTQFMDIVLIVDNMDDFTTNSLMFMTIVAVCCKATIAVFRRNGIISLVQMLLTEPCRPQDEDEVAIQMKFNKFIRSWSIRYSLLATSSVTGVTVRSVLNIMHGILPYRVWLPYDSNVSLSFWITSILQIVSVIFTTIINVGTETLVFGFFLQTCAQLEIFEKRLKKLVTNKKEPQPICPPSFPLYKTDTVISKHIYHHLCIFKYAKTVNNIFNQVLFVQFFSSILILCTSVYYLSSHITESESATLIVYTICMFVQIYVYCWSGNEVILKSASIGDTVYKMDWVSLSIKEKKDLLMIMKRSTIPIKFTSSFLITLSLQSYSNVVLIVDNMDDFATNSLMFMTIVGVCCKATVAVLRRDAIIDLIGILVKEPCKPRDETETAIQEKFDEFIRSCSIKYSLLATGSIMSFTIRSVLNVVQGHLPYRVWLPYNSNQTPLFLITSIHQIITLIFATIINVGTETLIFGLFLQTCVQLEIFECRLHKFVTHKSARCREYFSRGSSDKVEAIMSKYIRHHLSIYKYAKMLNSIFNQVLFFQFFGSILVLCTSVYYMSTHITGSEAATLPAYTICMFVQIFVYCWSGNEVILKSANIGSAIYHMNWPSLSIGDKKDLLMIMKRSTVPIKFTSSFLITFSLESYSNVSNTVGIIMA